ncbi:isoamylase early set domain-containing protein [bacterium]|nr:isoamylase early set domain-containing protein [bacterium]
MAAKLKTALPKKRIALIETMFVFGLISDASAVYLDSDFNNWDPKADRMREDRGRFRKTLALHSGDYQYKFLVDGEWHYDPAATTQIPNEFGPLNSVVHVTM